MHLVYIGLVWPEPDSTAAGKRSNELMQIFAARGWKVSFASAAQKSVHCRVEGVMESDCHQIELNSSSFNQWIAAMQPDVVVFDRFISEEQFGWRVAASLPNALRIIDTQDLHLLRYAREMAHSKSNPTMHSSLDYQNKIAIREIAAIYRSDLSLIISDFEMHLLREHFELPESLIHYIPFQRENIDTVSLKELPTFANRTGFVTIGSFNHPPNRDAIVYLKNEIWPHILHLKPDSHMHVYGSYMQAKDKQIEDPKQHFYMKGRAENVFETLSKHRILLAPLRFGAGIKGKLVDAMQSGTPFITSSIGAEGLIDEPHLSPYAADNPAEFARKTVELYESESFWKAAQLNGVELFNSKFTEGNRSESLVTRIQMLLEHRIEHRRQNFTGSMLMHHRELSTRYMSKWIEEKNKTGNNSDFVR
jgi:glycosyltransferase involved in cell wall biosynthesis